MLLGRVVVQGRQQSCNCVSHECAGRSDTEGADSMHHLHAAGPVVTLAVAVASVRAAVSGAFWQCPPAGMPLQGLFATQEQLCMRDVSTDRHRQDVRDIIKHGHAPQHMLLPISCCAESLADWTPSLKPWIYE